MTVTAAVPALIPAPILNRTILGLLVFDGLVSLVLGVLYLPTYLGTVQFPVSAFVSGAVNVALVFGARTVTDRIGLQSLPLIAWICGFLVCATAGPGGDVLLTQSWETLLFLVVGAAPPVVLLYIGANRTTV